MLCALLLATLLVPHPAQAQKTHVVIDKGVVRVNGKIIPREEWPEGLKVEGLEVRMSLGSGGHGTFSDLDGRMFRAEKGIIRQFTEEEYRQYSAELQEQSTELQERSTELRERSARLREQSERLVLQSMEILNASGVASDPSGSEVELFVHHPFWPHPQPPMRVEQSALDAANLEALAVYRAKIGTYFGDMQQVDRLLYERLLDEWGMEIETVQLAFEIRRLPEGEQREEPLGKLRELLEDAFELKQENRRREVARLESELEALRARLRERERQRDRLIEVRIRELLSESQ